PQRADLAVGPPDRQPPVPRAAAHDRLLGLGRTELRLVRVRQRGPALGRDLEVLGDAVDAVHLLRPLDRAARAVDLPAADLAELGDPLEHRARPAPLGLRGGERGDVLVEAAELDRTAVGVVVDVAAAHQHAHLAVGADDAAAELPGLAGADGGGHGVDRD